jgi:hypothetical protein
MYDLKFDFKGANIEKTIKTYFFVLEADKDLIQFPAISKRNSL